MKEKGYYKIELITRYGDDQFTYPIISFPYRLQMEEILEKYIEGLDYTIYCDKSNPKYFKIMSLNCKLINKLTNISNNFGLSRSLEYKDYEESLK